MPGVQTKGGAGVAKPSFERLELELKIEQNTQISMLPQFTTVLFSAFIQKLGSTSVV